MLKLTSEESQRILPFQKKRKKKKEEGEEGNIEFDLATRTTSVWYKVSGEQTSWVL